jgi:hypothetical protein
VPCRRGYEVIVRRLLTSHSSGRLRRTPNSNDKDRIGARRLTPVSLEHAFGQHPMRAEARPNASPRKSLALHFTSTMVLPIGASAIPASFRCCSPNGIPMIVMKQASADNK